MPKVGGRRVLMLLVRKKPDLIGRLTSSWKSNSLAFSWSKKVTAPPNCKRLSPTSDEYSTQIHQWSWRTILKLISKPILKPQGCTTSLTSTFCNNATIVIFWSNLENYLRIIKMGGGEMRFRIVNYCRMKDVLKEGGQPFSFSFKNPLAVMNGFSATSQMKMVGRSLQ